LVPFYLFLRRWPQMWLGIAALAALSIVLYFTWYKHLPAREESRGFEGQPEATAPGRAGPRGTRPQRW
jgi:hypothetical protein